MLQRMMLGFVVLFLFHPPLSARTGDVRLIVDHKAGIVYREGRVESPWVLANGRNYRAEIDEDQRVYVRIVNPNRLFYSYKITEGTKTPNVNFTNISSALASLDKLVKLRTDSAKSDQESMAIQTKEANSSFTTNLKDVKKYAESMQDIKRLTLTDSAGAREKVGVWNLQGIRTGLDQFYAGQSQIMISANTKKKDEEKDKEITQTELLLMVEAVQAKASLYQLVDELQAFRDAVNAVDEPIDDPIHIGFDPEYDQSLVLEITAIDPKQPGSYKTGKFTFQVVARTKFRFLWSAAAVFSTVDEPTYELMEMAAAGEDGMPALAYQIVEKEKDLNEFSVGGMLKVMPRSWDDPYMKRHWDLGISANDDSAGLLTGFGITFLNNRADLGIGAIYQRIDVLGKDLMPGQMLSSKDDLKLDKDWQVGYYIQVGITLGGTK